jgi:hypothetical protein
VSPKTLVCRNGHASDEPDYCSVCGAAMTTTGEPNPASTCPDCGTARADADARFCEVCRYDFEARTPGPPPTARIAAVAPTSPAPSASPPAPSAAPAATSPAAGLWEVTVTVDPSLDVDPDPAQPPPTGVGEREFSIDLPENLIGRRDDARDIRPQIPINDPAVSRRHAKLVGLPGGGLAIVDLASANGTQVNGTDVAAGEQRELADGDTITIGRWTRLVARQAPSPTSLSPT